MADRTQRHDSRPAAERTRRRQSGAFLLAALVPALAVLAFSVFAQAASPPGGAVEIAPGQVLGGEITRSDGDPAARYAVDARRSGGTVGFRIGTDAAAGVCGVRISDAARGRVRQHHVSSGRSQLNASVGVVRGWVIVELYTTAPRCRYELRVR